MSGWGCAQGALRDEDDLVADFQNITVVGLKVWENAQYCKIKHGDFQNLIFIDISSHLTFYIL